MKTQRFDYYFSFDRTTKFKKSPEGYLMGDAVLTTTGVYPYKDKDGSIHYELRPPEEVFNQGSMNTLIGKPITNDHPTELVTAENVDKYRIGMIGGGISQSDTEVIGFLVIQDADAVADVEAGKRALSCGYTLTRKDTDVSYRRIDAEGNEVTKTYPCPGVYNGVWYDRIQTEMEYNHLSLVDRGRAGDAARIRLDGEMVLTTQNPIVKKEPKMKKITLDSGLEYDAAPEVAVEFERMRALNKDHAVTIQGLEAKVSEALKLVDEKRAALDGALEENSKLKETIAGEATRLDTAVKARATLLSVAAKHGVEIKGDESDIDVKIAVIKKLKPNAKLDGESETYIDARFRSALEDAEVDTGNHSDSSDVPHGDDVNTDGASTDEATARETARQKYLDGLKNSKI